MAMILTLNFKELAYPGVICVSVQRTRQQISHRPSASAAPRHSFDAHASSLLLLPLVALSASIPSIGSASSSFSSTFTSSPAQTCMVGCQTMMTLSSDVLAAVQASPSPGAQQKSVGRAVCPGHDSALSSYNNEDSGWKRTSVNK